MKAPAFSFLSLTNTCMDSVGPFAVVCLHPQVDNKGDVSAGCFGCLDGHASQHACMDPFGWIDAQTWMPETHNIGHRGMPVVLARPVFPHTLTCPRSPAGPPPRRPPSIMPVQRAQLRTGLNAVPAAGAPPSVARVGAAGFRVEQRATYVGEAQVPEILLMGTAQRLRNATVSMQKRAELTKYKLRPGALEELGADEDDDYDVDGAGLASSMGAGSRAQTPMSLRGRSMMQGYDQQPYGGTRELVSLQRQIVDTQDAAHASKLEAERILAQTEHTRRCVAPGEGRRRGVDARPLRTLESEHFRCFRALSLCPKVTGRCDPGWIGRFWVGDRCRAHGWVGRFRVEDRCRAHGWVDRFRVGDRCRAQGAAIPSPGTPHGLNRAICRAVEDRVGKVKDNNKHLDTELGEIERQIEVGDIFPEP